jgi:secreted PhoX family phosphatase
MTTRRSFLSTASLAFVGLQRFVQAAEPSRLIIAPFGPLKEDPFGILDLPEGFTYRILTRHGQRMSDGFKSPGQSDGMAAFAGPDGKVVLVCNHEIGLGTARLGPYEDHKKLPDTIPADLCYDPGDADSPPHAGGTTNLVFDPEKGTLDAHFVSLVGTDRNCAGGAMPWGSWITCEEPEDLTSERGLRHGWCFEVKASAKAGIQKPVPLKGLGRFRHEAVALAPRSGILYLTEDRNEGLLYRFLPSEPRNFQSGRLQALAIVDRPSADLRNYQAGSTHPVPGERMNVSWIDMEDTDAPRDDLRIRGHQAGAATFARGEGIHFTDEGIYICCTDGGPSRRGQIFRLHPAANAGGQDSLELFLQPEETDLLTNGDNLCPAPWGGIVVCEDFVSSKFGPLAHACCVTPQGTIFTLARNHKKGELAGCCFSPDGKWFFVNIFSQGITVAITGPWEKAASA